MAAIRDPDLQSYIQFAIQSYDFAPQLTRLHTLYMRTRQHRIEPLFGKHIVYMRIDGNSTVEVHLTFTPPQSGDHPLLPQSSTSSLPMT